MSPIAPVATIPAISIDLATIDYIDAYCHDTALMHNTLIRAFNSISSHALKVLPSEIPPFSTYVAAFCETLRRHCEGENSIIFPQLAAHVALDGTDNFAVLQKLERVEEWVRDAVTTPGKTDPTELKAAMEVLAPAFASNMQDQIKQMFPSSLRTFISGPELRALVDEDIAWIGQHSHMEYLLPFIYLHHDRNTNSVWPGLPAEVEAALPALVEMHAACWEYAPFDLTGTIRSP